MAGKIGIAYIQGESAHLKIFGEGFYLGLGQGQKIEESIKTVLREHKIEILLIVGTAISEEEIPGMKIGNTFIFLPTRFYEINRSLNPIEADPCLVECAKTILKNWRVPYREGANVTDPKLIVRPKISGCAVDVSGYYIASGAAAANVPFVAVWALGHIEHNGKIFPNEKVFWSQIKQNFLKPFAEAVS